MTPHRVSRSATLQLARSNSSPNSPSVPRSDAAPVGPLRPPPGPLGEPGHQSRRSRARASAMTVEAGIASTSPAWYSLSRRSISLSHSRATTSGSSSTPSSRLAINRRARRARSVGGNAISSASRRSVVRLMIVCSRCRLPRRAAPAATSPFASSRLRVTPYHEPSIEPARPVCPTLSHPPRLHPSTSPPPPPAASYTGPDRHPGSTRSDRVRRAP
jgi:hypothetical protein